MLVASAAPATAAPATAAPTTVPPSDATPIRDAPPSAAAACLTTGTTAAGDAGNVSLDTYVAPDGSFDRFRNASALREGTDSDALAPASAGVDRTWDGEAVAYRDVVVHRVRLHGPAASLLDELAETDADSATDAVRTLVAGGELGFEYHGSTACPPELALNASADAGSVRVVSDRETDSLWFVFDVDRLRFHPLGGGEPTNDTYVRGHNGFSLTVRQSSGVVDADATVRTSYDVDDADVEFRGAAPGLVRAPSRGDVVLRGETVLAHGSEVTVRLRRVDGGHAVERTAEVNDSRAFATNLTLPENASGSTYAVGAPGVTGDPVSRAGATLLTVGNASDALVDLSNQTSEGAADVLYGPVVSSTSGGFAVVTDDSGDRVAVSDYLSPGSTVAQIYLTPPRTENGTLSVTLYRDVDGDRELDDADAPYRTNGSVVRDAGFVRADSDTPVETPREPVTDDESTQTAAETTSADAEAPVRTTVTEAEPATATTANQTATGTERRPTDGGGATTATSTPGFGVLASLAAVWTLVVASVLGRRRE